MNTSTDNVTNPVAALTVSPTVSDTIVSSSTQVVMRVTQAMPAITTTCDTDVASLMCQMADQQNMISMLTEQLQVKLDEDHKVSEEQRKEMNHLYDTISTAWADQQDTVNVKTRDEFKNCIIRLADVYHRYV
jgi:hypothetical protein